MDENWNALKKVASFTGIVGDQRQSPSQISLKIRWPEDPTIPQRATGTKIWVLAMHAYLTRFLAAAATVEAPEEETHWVTYEMANMSTKVTSQGRQRATFPAKGWV